VNYRKFGKYLVAIKLLFESIYFLPPMTPENGKHYVCSPNYMSSQFRPDQTNIASILL